MVRNRGQWGLNPVATPNLPPGRLRKPLDSALAEGPWELPEGNLIPLHIPGLVINHRTSEVRTTQAGTQTGVFLCGDSRRIPGPGDKQICMGPWLGVEGGMVASQARVGKEVRLPQPHE